MSSNMEIVKICEYCKKDFLSKKLTSQCCSPNCSKRFYALKKRNGNIAHVEQETALKRKYKATISIEQLALINAKELLTLKEAAILLNISPLTLRRWTLSGKMVSHKLGKKHIFIKANITTAFES